jgi:undecaprenyl-diphosphatase
MTVLQALTLGLVQGFGEFLPISSSGHLIVVPWLLGWPEQPLAFDVALHLGTLAAVVTAFAADWLRLLRAGLSDLLRGRPFESADSRLLWLVAMASVPGAVVGLLFEHQVETVFRSPLLVAGTMAVMGAVLFVADRQANGGRSATGITVGHAALIGIAQSAALVPGVSRSGATISMALLLGYEREEAARFSFLLATPITFGAAALKVPALLASGSVTPVLIGIAAAAIAGFLSIKVLLAYVRTRTYRPFVWYRLAFAALVVAVFLLRGGR